MQKDDFTVLDPFCGSGTTLVETSLMGLKSIGYDINPFLTFVSQTKTDLRFDLHEIDSEILQMERNLIPSQIKNISWSEDLKLSELYANNHVFSTKVLPKVLLVKRFLNDIQNQRVHNFFMLALYLSLVQSVIKSLTHSIREDLDCFFL